jgi:type II secretory ATPase GspE/PulE/Tfp pilus assembly ATPase PilB-like protein
VRVSTVPTVYGENVVLRLHSAKRVLVGLENLGLSEENLNRIEGMLARPYGMILATGPTGSGKTTTLYSALQRINSSSRNIVTIEDPVECRMELVRQIQVNARANVTFANGLRAILRQDPDVIMVGEIRDGITAEIAVQAALTGHLVLSTLHTNDAPGVVIRLIDMGVEPFLVSASVIGAVAQRLVRKICESCKESYSPRGEILKRWGLEGTEGVRFYRGVGCNRCRGTGYSGRVGLFEVMEVNSEIRDIILQKERAGSVQETARNNGMPLLSEDGLAKALTGMTTIEEVARVTEAKVDIGPSCKRATTSVTEAEASDGRFQASKKAEVDVNSYARQIESWAVEK